VMVETRRPERPSWRYSMPPSTQVAARTRDGG
jgi:hypothetical protein